MIWQLDILLLTLVLVSGIASLLITDVLSASIVFGAYSFLMCLVWAGMGAVDVAFTEAAVGAGVSTVFFVGMLYNTVRLTKKERPKVHKVFSFPLIATFVALVLGGLLLTVINDFPAWGDVNSPVNTHVSSYYLEHSLEHSNVPNVVTSVLADYRSFDTMFETCVVFVAGIAIFGIMRRGKRDKGGLKPPFQKVDSLIIRVACRFMVPFIQLFALYVVAHGHHSPGGGFQGGVMLGASVILLAISYDLKTALKKLTEKWMIVLSAVGVVIFAGVGVICIIKGGNFLNYTVLHTLLPGTDEVMARSHSMLGVEIGVALTVMCALFAIYATLSSDGRLDEGL